MRDDDPGGARQRRPIDAFVKATYSKMADAYVRECADDQSDLPYIDAFLQGLRPASRILDAGCGAGQFAAYMREHGHHVHGVDVSPEMLRHALARVPTVPFALMDMRSLAFPDASFDALLAAYSLIHIPSDELPVVLHEFRRVLAPDGQMLLITQKGRADHFVAEPLLPGERSFVNFFTTPRLRRYLRAAGFTVAWQKEVAFDPKVALSDRVIYTLAGAL